MTEQEWLECADPQKMLALLRGKASDRKLRLFAVACCRQIRHLFLDDRLLLLLEGFEREADGQATVQDSALSEDWLEEQQILGDTWGVLEVDDERRRQFLNRPLRKQTENLEAIQAILWVLDWDTAILLGDQGEEQVDALLAAIGTANTVTLAAGEPPLATRKAEAVHLRDIFGNPFRPVIIAPSWLTPNVLGLAQATYDNRILPAGTLDNARLAVLADALEDAGCDTAEILTHCRSEGTHVRGCWLVDLLLGKQ